MKPLTLDLIEDAEKFLEGKIRKTPLEYSSVLSEMLGGPVFLKLENLQTTGSFKIRGAWFRLSKLSDDEKKRGVITCSAGNHGKAVAYAAKQLNIAVTIYVPSSVDKSKYNGMLALGATVIRSSHHGYDDTEIEALEQAREMKMPFISAFDDNMVMAANGGSLAKEILIELPNTSAILVPVGGGGLCGGLSYYVKETAPHCHIYACQLAASAALKLSLEKKSAVTRLPAIETIAGGLEGGIGERTFAIIRDRLDGISLIEENEIAKALTWCLSHHQYLIEPSSAVAIAAALKNEPALFTQFPLVIVLSGRNINIDTLKVLLCS